MNIDSTPIGDEHSSSLPIQSSPVSYSNPLEHSSSLDQTKPFEKGFGVSVPLTNPIGLPSLLAPENLILQSIPLQEILDRKIEGANEIVEESLKLLNAHISKSAISSDEILEMQSSLKDFLKMISSVLLYFHQTQKKEAFLEIYDEKALISTLLKLSEIRARFSDGSHAIPPLFKMLPATQIKLLAPIVKFTFEEICFPFLKLVENKDISESSNFKRRETQTDSFKIFWKAFFNKEINFEYKEIYPQVAYSLSFLPFPKLAEKMLLSQLSSAKINDSRPINQTPVNGILPSTTSLDLLLIKIIIHQALGFILINQLNPLFDPFEMGTQTLLKWLKEKTAELLTNTIDGYASLSSTSEKKYIEQSLIVFALLLSIGYAHQQNISKIKIIQTLEKISSYSDHLAFFSKAALLLLNGCETKETSHVVETFIRHLSREKKKLNEKYLENLRVIQYLLIEMMKKLSLFPGVFGTPTLEADSHHKEDYFSIMIQG